MISDALLKVLKDSRVAVGTPSCVAHCHTLAANLEQFVLPIE
jgi:hypothetical protein